MNDIKYYNSLFIYQFNSLQVIFNTLSRISNIKEEILFINIKWFMILNHEISFMNMNHIFQTFFIILEYEFNFNDMKNISSSYIIISIKIMN